MAVVANNICHANTDQLFCGTGSGRPVLTEVRVQCQASVYVQGLAGNVIGIITGEKGECGCDFIGLGRTPQGNVLLNHRSFRNIVFPRRIDWRKS